MSSPSTQDDGRMCEKGQCKVTQYAGITDSLSLAPRPSLRPDFITSSMQNEPDPPCASEGILTQGGSARLL